MNIMIFLDLYFISSLPNIRLVDFHLCLSDLITPCFLFGRRVTITLSAASCDLVRAATSRRHLPSDQLVETPTFLSTMAEDVETMPQ